MKTLLLAGVSNFEPEEMPPFMAPVGGSTVLERIAAQVLRESHDEVLVLVPSAHVEAWHLDHAVKQVSKRVRALPVHGMTHGAACTALLAIDELDPSEELLVLASDEYISCDYLPILQAFRSSDHDAATVVFRSWHPRFSYVLIEEGRVVEAAEKDPISNMATAGFYWFRKSENFVESALSMIRKRAAVNENYFVCPVFNEMILTGKSVGTHQILPHEYVPLKNQLDLLSSTNRLNMGGV
jgi:NDP-sugar pyrophosphorylase family protein